MKVHYLEIVASNVDAVCAAYWLVDDIDAALGAAAKQGAFVAHSPLEIPGKGTFVIYIQGGVEHGLWQLEAKS